MAPPSRSPITCLVLAGGCGARIGDVDKGWVVLEVATSADPDPR
jgi:molybdopterin-guanine dinucleotide biosynthesis protein A